MAESVGEIYYEVDGRTQGLLDAERQVNRSTRNMERSFDRTDRSVIGVTESLGKLSAVASAVGSALAVQRVVAYADAWTNLQNQLRQVTDTENERARVTDQVMKIANETRSGIESTANLYARLTRASSELGLSEQRRLRITKTINQAFATSGATAEEASAAITQLSQGLAAGALRGDEFNSVAEQAPAIMRAIADEANMTIGELREFAATGGITADLVVRALEGAADAMDDKFAKATRSFGQSMEIANNNLTEFIGTSDAVRTAVDTSGNVIVTLSENIDDVVRVAGLAATAIGVRLLQAITATIASQAAASVGAASLSAAYSTMGARAATAAIAVNTLRSGIALLGGPVGVAFLAATAIYQFRDELGLTSQQADSTQKQLAELRGEMRDLSNEALESQVKQLSSSLLFLEDQARNTQMVIDNLGDAGGTFDGQSLGDMRDQLEQINKNATDTKDTIAQLKDLMNGGDGNVKDTPPAPTAGEAPTSGSDQTKQETEKLQQEMDRRRQAVISALQSESEAAYAEYQQRNVEIQSLFEDGSDQQRELLERNNEDYLSRIQDLNQRERDEQQRHQEQLAKMRQEDYARRLQEITGFSDQAVQKLLEIQANAADPMAALTRNLGDAFVNLDDTIASTFVNAMSRGEGLNDILGEIGRTVLASLLQSFIKLGVQMAVNAAMGSAYQSAAAATAAATGATIAASYAPAAAMVSLATLGANAVPAAAALSSTTALASGLAIAGGRQYGGNVNAGSAYRVTEDGKPELYSDGTRSYLLPGRNGKVTANKDMAASGGGTPAVTVQLYGTGAENARVSQSEGPNREQIIQIMLEDAYENGPVRRAYGV
ncbi:MAG: tape measure protein [Pseudomonadota bacterium]|nr:tape measure protein [Pseudomonadota bacterium]